MGEGGVGVAILLSEQFVRIEKKVQSETLRNRTGRGLGQSQSLNEIKKCGEMALHF
jgi:hypothetical protein